MQRFAVIGLGRFGSRLAANLTAAGQEVIGVDREARVIEELRDRVTLAVALDATDQDALLAQGIDHVDIAVISVGGNFEAAALSTAILKQIGVRRVISRAVTATGARILKRIGADEVVNPEDESADRWALRLTNPWMLRHFELDRDYSLIEIKTPPKWVGKTLTQLKLRTEANLQVVAIGRSVGGPDDKNPRRTGMQVPMPDQPLGAEDLLILMGRESDLARLPIKK